MREVAGLAAAGVEVHAAAHITGGGLAENLPRALPDGLRAVLDTASWERGPAYDALLATGRVDEDEAWSTFNMGLGMCLVVAPERVPDVLARVPDARRVGHVAPGRPE